MVADKHNGLPEELAQKVRLVLEFHLWGGTAEGVTSGSTVYGPSYTRQRETAAELSSLSLQIASRLKGRLPGEFETLVTAGRMYRRSADYVKAGEYFVKALDLVYRRQGCG